MLSVFEGNRYAMNKAGLYIGWPLVGAGTFGDWSLGAVTWGEAGIEHIEFVQALSPHEVRAIKHQPVSRWFVRVHPKQGGAWALMRCRFNPCAQAATVVQPHTAPRRPDDLSDKVAV